MEKKLIVFDVDGVLFKNQRGAFKDVLVLLGKKNEVEKIDKEYQKRRSFGPWGLEELAMLCRNFSKKELTAVALRYSREVLREEAEECLAELRMMGYKIGAISSNPQFIMNVLKMLLRLDFSEGTQLEFKKRKATGEIKRKVDRNVKAKILEEKIKELEIKKENVIVVGDSITDIAMAEIAGIFIAFRPKDKILREKAHLIINNLWQLTQGVLL